MRLPPQYAITNEAHPAESSASPLTFVLSFIKDGSKFTTGDWSSLIGIITAICGNILISIALNTQRYAHIKLSEQYEERRRLVKRAQKRTARQQEHGYTDEGYGTSSPAETSHVKQNERVHTNGAAARYRDEPEEHEATEDQPLLGSSTNGNRDTDDDSSSDSEDDKAREEEAEKSYLKSPYWWAGIIMMTVGEAGNFLAYGFAPASIVSPLGVVALISNCIIAPFFLKEKFRKRDALGVLIAVAGAVTVVLSANDSNPKLGPDEIWKLIGTWEFETYLGITIALIIALMWASTKYGEKSIFIDLGLVGLFGGYTALSTKGVASMLSYTVFKALTFPITYLLVAILVSTAVMQIKYVNRALKRFNSTQVIPTQFVMFTLSVIIGSAILYRDFEKESAANAGKFIGGCAMTFLGVYFITSARDKDDDEDEVLEEDEEAIRLASEGAYHDEPVPSSKARPAAQRGTTAPTAGNRIDPSSWSPPATPSRSSTAGDGAPIITRTTTQQSTTLLDGEISEPMSIAVTPSSEQSPWLEPNASLQASMQNLLAPLDRLVPHQSARVPSPLKSTTSEPILPMEATIQPSRPSTPPNAPRSQTEAELPPATPLTAARHSLQDLIPGPLTATLSSPLSAIVADSLRRGVDVRSLRPKARRRRILPPNPQDPQRNNSETEIEGATEGLSRATTRTQEGNEARDIASVRRSRLRSLSGTLGDLFRSSKRVKRDGGGEDGDVEEGRAAGTSGTARTGSI